MLRQKAHYTILDYEQKPIVMADNSPMDVRGKIQAEVKLGGILFPAEFLIIDRLGYDVIIGQDILETTKANINIHTKTLSLYDGLVNIQMSHSGNFEFVKTITAVTIPPLSEAIVSVQCTHRPNSGDYMIEGHSTAANHPLLIGKSLINIRNITYPCRVMNITEKEVKLKSKTILGILSPVMVENAFHSKYENVRETKPKTNHEEQLKAVSDKGISLANCAITGNDFHSLVDLLYNNLDLFATSLKELPGCSVLKLRIETGDSPPVKLRSYRQSPEDRAEISRQVNELLDAGIVTHSDTPYSSPVLLVKKKDGSKRLVVDYRVLNSQTALISWKLNTFDEILDCISEKRPTLWSTLDLRSGFWQTALDEETAHKTGFETNEGTFCFQRTSMGLCNAPSHFSCLMSKIFQGLAFETLVIYIDDLLLFARDPGTMVRNLGQAFDRLRNANLKLHPSKCNFGVKEVVFLGHRFDSNGYGVNEDKIKIVKNYPVPKNPKQIKQFLGLASYYRRFVKSFSTIAEPLRNLLRKDVPFVWSDDCQTAFDKLKTALTTAPTLALPDFTLPFVLTTDACTTGIGWTLSNKHLDGSDRVCSFGGRSLRPNERNWCVSELEGLSMIEGIRANHVYLAHKPFEIVTDHRALIFIKSMKLPSSPRLTRMSLFLQGYNFNIIYKPGPQNMVADALSRIPYGEAEVIEPDDSEVIANVNLSDRVLIEFDIDRVNGITEMNNVAVMDDVELPTLDDIRESVTHCPDFGPMYKYLEQGVLPSDDEVARKLVLKSQEYVLREGVLYHLYTPRTKRLDRAMSTISQVCIGQCLHEKIIRSVHLSCSHLGFNRLYDTIKSRFYWDKMYTEIHDFVTTCFECQRCKPNTHPLRNPVGKLDLALPLTRWNLDIHGKYCVSDGKKYVLAFICTTSGWAELIPVENTSAEVVVQAIHDHIICRYGLCRGLTIHSDCGSAFISKLTKLYCDKFGITQSFSSPYNARANSRVESLGNSINSALRLLCESQSDWSKHLQSVAYSLRASASSNIILSPFETIFARKMEIPCDLILPEVSIGDLKAHVRDVGERLKVLGQIALQNAIESGDRSREQKNKDAQLPPYKVGDRVLLNDTTIKKGQCRKLHAQWKGPYCIIAMLPGQSFKLQHCISGDEIKRPVFVNRIRPLKERINDSQRVVITTKQSTIFEAPIGQGRIEIVLDDITARSEDGLLCYVNESLKPIGEDAQRTHALGAAEVRSALSRATNGNSVPSGLVVTTAANMPANSLIHVVLTDELDADVRNKLLYGLHMANDHVESIAIPFAGIKCFENQLWESAQLMIELIMNFFSAPNMNDNIKKICIVCNSLRAADVLRTVCRKILSPTINVTDQGIPIDNRETDIEYISGSDAEIRPPLDNSEPILGNNTASYAENDQSTNNPPLDNDDQWYPIDRILKQRMFKSRRQFLIKFSDSDVTSWVDRKHVTDAAVTDFLLTRKSRRRRRRQ